MNYSKNLKWSLYSHTRKNQPPHQLSIKAYKLFGQYKGNAIDIGCGPGNECIFLYNNGWDVLAVDKNANSLAYLKKECPNIQTYEVLLEDINELPRADLVLANYSIPFCQPQYFDNLMKILLNAVAKNGRFAGNFIGLNDDWSQVKNKSFCSAETVKSLFASFEIEHFIEKEYDDKTAFGKDKHWHVIDIIAKK